MEPSGQAKDSLTWLDQRSAEIADAWLGALRALPGEPVVQVPEADLREVAAAGVRMFAGAAGSSLDRLRRDLADLRTEYDLPIPEIITALGQLGGIACGRLIERAGADEEGRRVEAWRLSALWSDVMLQCALHLSQELGAKFDTYRAQASALLRVAQAVSNSLDLHEVLVRIRDELMDLLGCRCNTFLMDDQGNLRYEFAEPLPSQFVVPHPPEQFNMEAFRRKAPVYCYDAALDPLTDKATVHFFGLKSLLAVPFIYRDRVVAVGLLVPWPPSYRRFTQEELDLVQAIANTTAVAIENARLYRRTELLVVTQERNRLAREMHDNLAQTLALVKLQVNGLLAADLTPPVQQTLREMKDLVSDAYVDLRDTIFAMGAFHRPGGNLSAELREFADTFARHHHLVVDVDVSEDAFESIPPADVGHVIRIIEESLINVRKHARAAHVWVSVLRNERSVRVQIRDDGCGFDPTKVREKPELCMGLSIMRARAAEARGELQIHSRPGEGTTVLLDLASRSVDEPD